MGKRLDVSKLIDLNTILERIEQSEFVALAIGDKYHDEGEVVNEMPYFKKVDGKTVIDEEAGIQYYYVSATMQSSEKAINLMDVQLRSEEFGTFERLEEDDTFTVSIDRKKSELSVATGKNITPYVSLEIYVTSVDVEDDDLD